MSGANKSRSKVKELPLDEDGPSAIPSIDWRPLKNYNGAALPTLIWASVPAADQLVEADHAYLPAFALIQARHAENRARKERKALLGSKAFWDAFRRSKLVVLFDRHADYKLLHRLRNALEPGMARSLQTLLVIVGKDEKRQCAPLVRNIKEVLLNDSTLNFQYLEGMESSKAPFPHDRFAVTDGEFWHFGGSVGCVEQCLTGVSRGWRASDVGVQGFLEATLAAKADWDKP